MSQTVNPYASPAVAAPMLQPSGAPVKEAPPFLSGAARARFTIVMLGICAMLDLLIAGSTLMQIQLLGSADPVLGIDPAAAQANDLRQNVLSFTSVAATLLTAIVFCFWVYRAHQNLPSLRAALVEHTPGWAVGSYFVPILNLFRPCQIMLEIWRESDPERLPPMGAPSPATLVGWWWGLWITTGVVDRISITVSREAETIPDLIASSWFVIVVAALGMPLAMCALLMVSTIDRNQTARYAKVQSAPIPQPNLWSTDSTV